MRWLFVFCANNNATCIILFTENDGDGVHRLTAFVRPQRLSSLHVNNVRIHQNYRFNNNIIGVEQTNCRINFCTGALLNRATKRRHYQDSFTFWADWHRRTSYQSKAIFIFSDEIYCLLYKRKAIKWIMAFFFLYSLAV